MAYQRDFSATITIADNGLDIVAATREKDTQRRPICDSLNTYREPLNGAQGMDFCLKLPYGP